jgi:MOSC domain-containing protein YiiM
MELISVNIGREQAIQNAKPSGVTGIFKRPAAMPVRVTRAGIPGDAVCDVKHHGGPDQALYVYGEPDYAWWAQTLGREMAPGTFGENLTIGSLESAKFSVGDTLKIGEVVIQVTAPRSPCKTLAAVMGDPQFIKAFRAAERPGLYCRVLQEGTVKAGDPVEWTPYQGETVTILEMYRDDFAPDLREETLRRYLAAPIAVRGRREKEEQLQTLLAQK